MGFVSGASGDLNLLFLMFFDVLEVPGPSWNDSGSILDRSFFHHFFLKVGSPDAELK